MIKNFLHIKLLIGILKTATEEHIKLYLFKEYHDYQKSKKKKAPRHEDKGYIGSIFSLPTFMLNVSTWKKQ